jgi:hypothetical protein
MTADDGGTPPDGSASDGGGTGTCTDVSGAWSLANLIVTGSGTCGTAMVGYGVTVSAGATPCDITFASTATDQAALDGTATWSSEDAFSGTLSLGGGTATACTGMLSGSMMTVVCDGYCVMTLSR